MKRIQYFQLIVGIGKPKQGNYDFQQNYPKTEEVVSYVSNMRNGGLTVENNF